MRIVINPVSMNFEGSAPYTAVNTPQGHIGFRCLGYNTFFIIVEQVGQAFHELMMVLSDNQWRLREVPPSFRRMVGQEHSFVARQEAPRFWRMVGSEGELREQLIAALTVLLKGVTNVSFAAGDDEPVRGREVDPQLQALIRAVVMFPVGTVAGGDQERLLLIDAVVCSMRTGGITAADMSNESPWAPGTTPATESLIERGLKPASENRELVAEARAAGFTPGDMQPTPACLESGVVPDPVSPRDAFSYKGYKRVDNRLLGDAVRTCDTPAQTMEPTPACLENGTVPQPPAQDGSARADFKYDAHKHVDSRLLTEYGRDLPAAIAATGILEESRDEMLAFLHENRVQVDESYDDATLQGMVTRVKAILFLRENLVEVDESCDDATLQVKIDELTRKLESDHGLDPAAEFAQS